MCRICTYTYYFDSTLALLLEHQLVEISLHNHVLHTLHRLVKKCCVGCIRVVDVYLLARIAHEILELPREELLTCFDVSIVACEVGEVFADRCFAGRDLLAEDVHLVEEKDERGSLKVFTVCYALEEHERLVHLVLGSVSLILSCWLNASYSIAIFNKDVVVAADSDEEEDYIDVIEDMDPLLALRSLTADIEHAERKAASLKNRFADARCA